MISKIKSLLINRISDVIDSRLAHNANNSPLFGDSYWYESANLWEPPVLLALKDLCHPGMVVFDVGGNFGGLTSAMSRLVGPRGIVCTFEASPRIIGHLQSNVVKQGHSNVTVYHRAVYSRSNEIVMIYDGDHLNDSIYPENSPNKNGRHVKTLALDDFCDASGLVPDVIKMDIEGAEFDALNGAVKLIQQSKPHFLLEQQAADMRCFEFMISRGYVALDLNNYRQIKSKSDYPSNAPLRNVLFVHEERIAEIPYELPMSVSEINRVMPSQFNTNHMHGYTSDEFELDAGRYLLDVDFSASGTANDLMCGVRYEGRDIFRYQGYSKLISDNYRDWVIDISQRGSISIYFDFQNNTRDPTFRLNGVRIFLLHNISSKMWPSLACD